MRGEEAVKAAETLLVEALDDLRAWESSPDGSPAEPVFAESVRLKVALAHELGLLQYADEPEPDQEPDEPDPGVVEAILCGHETVVGERFIPVACTLEHGHGGAHHGSVAFEGEGVLLFPLEAARLDKAQPARNAPVKCGAMGEPMLCSRHEPKHGLVLGCELELGHAGDHESRPVPFAHDDGAPGGTAGPGTRLWS